MKLLGAVSIFAGVAGVATSTYTSKANIFDEHNGSFEWTVAEVNGECSLSFKLRVEGDRWLGFGLGTEMVHSHVVIASKVKDASKVNEYIIGDEESASAITLATDQSIQDSSWQYANGYTEVVVNHTTAIAGKKLNLDCSGAVSSSAFDEVVFAIGADNSDFQNEHIDDFEATINWGAGTFQKAVDYAFESDLFPPEYEGNLKWNLAESNGACMLSFKLKVKGDRWIAIGLGTEMTNSHVIIASKRQNASHVKEYTIGDEESASSIVPAPQQTLSDVKWELVDGYTLLYVNNIDSIAGKPLNLDCSGSNKLGDEVIFAVGGDNANFEEHVEDLEATINWGAGTFTEAIDYPFETDIFPPEYESVFKWSVDKVDGECVLSFKLKVKGDRWVAVGLGTEMMNSHVIIASKNKNATNVKEYLIGDAEAASAITLAPNQNLGDVKWEYLDGFTLLYVNGITSIAGKQLTLACSNSGARRLADTIGDAVIFAVGGDNTNFEEHVEDLELNIDWGTGKVITPSAYPGSMQIFAQQDGSFEWQVAKNNGECQLSFKLRVKGDRWVSIGLGKEMMNSNVIIASKKKDPSVKEYVIGNAESASAIKLASTQTLKDVHWEFDNEYTELLVNNITAIAGKKLTLDCSASSRRRRILSGSSSGLGDAVIFAIGGDNTNFDQHIADTKTNIEWSSPASTMPPTPTSPAGTPAPTPAPPLDQGYTGSMSLFPSFDGLFEWKTEKSNGDCLVSFKFKVKGDRWVSVGLGTTMMNSNVIIASKRKDSTKPGEYLIGNAESASAITLAPIQSLSSVEWTFSNGYTELNVNNAISIGGKKLSATCNAPNSGSRLLTSTGIDDMIFAIGGDNSNFDQHVDDLVTTVDWSSSVASGEPQMNRMINAHAFLMSIGMGLLLPLAIFSGLTKHKEWFHVHRGLISLVLLFIILGFAFAVSQVENHLSEPHYIVGFVSFLLMLVNPIVAVVRPDKGGSHRTVWLYIHRSIAFSAIVLAFYNIYSGAHLVGNSPEFFGSNSEKGAVAFIVIGCLILVAGVGLRVKNELEAANAPPKPEPSRGSDGEPNGVNQDREYDSSHGVPVHVESSESVKIQLQ